MFKSLAKGCAIAVSLGVLFTSCGTSSGIDSAGGVDTDLAASLGQDSGGGPDVLARGLLARAHIADRSIALDRYQILATNTKLLPADSNIRDDVYERDLQTGTTTLLTPDENAGTSQASGEASISSDGTYVVFRSLSNRLVAGDTNAFSDIFQWDRTTGDVIRLTPNSVNGHCLNPMVSADGNRVVFATTASNLPGSGTDDNGQSDIYLWTRTSPSAGTFSRISLNASGAQLLGGPSVEPTISFDGASTYYATYLSKATNAQGHTPTNTRQDVYRVNLATSSTVLVSIADDDTTLANGNSWPGSISADGNRILFTSDATNLVAGDGSHAFRDVFVRDIGAMTTTLISRANAAPSNGHAEYVASISSDGRWAAFSSAASNLVAGDTNGKLDVFRRDLNNLGTSDPERISLSDKSVGELAAPQLTGNSDYPAYGYTNNMLAFRSVANDVMVTDPDALMDIYVRDLARSTPATIFASMASTSPKSVFGDFVSNGVQIEALWNSGVFE